MTIAVARHDGIIRTQHVEWMGRSIPGARLKILPEASHFARPQKPDDFNRAVLEPLSP